MPVILMAIVKVVFCVVAVILVVVVLGGAYMLATGRVPPPRRWWAAERSHPGQPLVRPRVLGLGLVMICGLELVIVWFGLAEIASFNENEPTGQAGAAGFLASVSGMACITALIYLQKWAYRAPRDDRDT